MDESPDLYKSEDNIESKSRSHTPNTSPRVNKNVRFPST